MIEELAGVRTTFEDVTGAAAATMDGQDLAPHQESAIARAIALLEHVR